MNESNDAAEGAGLSLGDLWAIAQMQRLVVLSSLVGCVVIAVLYLLVATRMYTSKVVMVISTSAGQEIQTDRVLDMDQYHRWNLQMFVRTQIEVMRSRELLLDVLADYQSMEPGSPLQPDDAGVAAMQSGLSIATRQGTELIDVELTTNNAERSARLANLIAEQYQQQNLDAMTDSAVGAKRWLEEQLDEHDLKISKASDALVAFQRLNGLADAEDELTSLTATMDSLNNAYGNAKTERVLQQTKVDTYELLLRRGAYQELAKEMASPLMARLTEAFSSATAKQAKVAAVYGEKMPERKAADAELKRVEQELRDEVRRTLSAERANQLLLEEREARLREAIGTGKGELLVDQQAREEYEKLRLTLDRAKDFYRRLGERRDELDLQSKTQLNNVRIIEAARAAKGPSSPRVLWVLGGGVAGGLVLGVLLGLAREFLDDTISSPLEVTTHLRSSFLGMVPKIEDATSEEDQALYTHTRPRSTVAEAMRGIRTILELDANGPPKRLLVTSAVASEGKTSTIIRLAVAFSSLGKKVLLIDGDLRRPRIHKVFGFERDNGLAGVIAQDVSLDEAIHPTGLSDLWVMPSGKGGERPSELLSSPRLPKILAELDDRFDIVLVDTPPTVLLSDARVLSRYVDGCVVVIREHATSRNLIREGVRGLEQVGAHVYGVVINAVDFGKHRTSYKYYYGYGYRYDQYYYTPDGETPGEEPPSEA